MRADPPQGYVNRRGPGLSGTADQGNGAGREFICIVQGNGEIGPAEALVKVVDQHCFGAVDGLLGGLAYQHQRAMPLRPQCRKRSRSADQGGHVHIVPARMHHAHIQACRILGSDMAGVRNFGLLDDRQCVHVSSYQEPGPGTVFENAYHAIGLRTVRIFADTFSDLVACLAQLRGQNRSGTFLVMRQFGMRMYTFVGFDQARQLRADGGFDALRRDRNGSGGKRIKERKCKRGSFHGEIQMAMNRQAYTKACEPKSPQRPEVILPGCSGTDRWKWALESMQSTSLTPPM